MKSLILLLALFTQLVSAHSAMDKIRVMEKSNPDLPDAIVELQNKMLKNQRWENVLGIGYIFRSQFSQNESSFRIRPFLMEAYSLIQYCRYDDARAVLEQGEFFASKYKKQDDLHLIKKAKELEGLSKLYKNLKVLKHQDISFSKNHIQWTISADNESVLNVLDKILIRPESLCRS